MGSKANMKIYQSCRSSHEVLHAEFSDADLQGCCLTEKTTMKYANQKGPPVVGPNCIWKKNPWLPTPFSTITHQYSDCMIHLYRGRFLFYFPKVDSLTGQCMSWSSLMILPRDSASVSVLTKLGFSNKILHEMNRERHCFQESHGYWVIFLDKISSIGLCLWTEVKLLQDGNGLVVLTPLV